MAKEIILWLVMTVLGVSIALTWAVIDRRKYLNRNRRQEHIHHLAEEAGLSLTNVDSIAGGMVGFDSAQGVLLVVMFGGTRPKWSTIRLADVASSTVLTNYKVLPTATTNLYSLNKLIDQVALQFQFENGDPPVLLPFYNARHHKVADLPEREARAREWQQFLVGQEEEKSDRA